LDVVRIRNTVVFWPNPRGRKKSGRGLVSSDEIGGWRYDRELEDGRKVRYIGINAPETVDPRRKVECFGREASDFNVGLVEGKRVRLEKDVSETDRYGRLLRFVYLEDGGFVNEILVREGYAYASAYGPDIARKELFAEAEKDARKNRRGLWASDTCDGHRESTY